MIQDLFAETIITVIISPPDKKGNSCMKEILLLRLTLENFKACPSRTFEFDGRNASIYGANGTGKSTVYNALTWLLFDKIACDDGTVMASPDMRTVWLLHLSDAFSDEETFREAIEFAMSDSEHKITVRVAPKEASVGG